MFSEFPSEIDFFPISLDYNSIQIAQILNLEVASSSLSSHTAALLGNIGSTFKIYPGSVTIYDLHPPPSHHYLSPRSLQKSHSQSGPRIFDDFQGFTSSVSHCPFYLISASTHFFILPLLILPPFNLPYHTSLKTKSHVPASGPWNLPFPLPRTVFFQVSVLFTSIRSLFRHLPFS
jgi:hypothetical protein